MSAAMQAELGGAIGPGVLVAVMGPSGSGKDTLIAHARARLGRDRVVFVRRIVTRAADSSAEDHDTMSPQDFAVADGAGAFAVSWIAHGLSYGLPSSVDSTIAAGKVAVANVSRAVLPLLKRRYRHVVAVHVHASPDVLAARIAARGRESGDAIQARLARDPGVPAAGADVVRIDNSGALHLAVDKLVAEIEAAMATGAVQA
jgi:ribose 1,5-bisphosphokinase